MRNNFLNILGFKRQGLILSFDIILCLLDLFIDIFNLNLNYFYFIIRDIIYYIKFKFIINKNNKKNF
jgi:hypothetical protein